MMIRIHAIFLILAFSLNPVSSQVPVKLIVRADDMGNSYDIGLAVVKAHREGIVTSVSVMPTSPFFEEAVRLCQENPDMAAGVHITLLGTRLRPVLSPADVPSLVTRQGFFYETGEELARANPDSLELEKEIRAQVEKARTGGLHFVYLDYHRGPPKCVEKAIIKICREQRLLYGQDIDGSVYGYNWFPNDIESWPFEILPDSQRVYYAAPSLTSERQQLFFNALMNMRPGQWILVMHPGLAGPERASVTELLCSSRVKEIIRLRNIQLVSYYDIWKEVMEK